ncbi:Diphosphoinositol polyphosphate phosphohydrolase 1 [Portunus trituberculatus]|uniref:Diphosphoinositol polyphosphate phosphohydrolase 1 n=1 Tax=Portunus trituberculatus TaxID=210409 RepID=A0A5B7DVD6_PORTR|nr:Diphosphoinositol polyphosphate phosphohydrolase 1 [Portunus trituberculatus]
MKLLGNDKEIFLTRPHSLFVLVKGRDGLGSVREGRGVLLVTSKKDPCVWLVPGGGLEVGEEAIVAAQREAWEEAGIQGVVKRFLGLFEVRLVAMEGRRAGMEMGRDGSGRGDRRERVRVVPLPRRVSRQSCHHSGTKKHRTAVFVFMVTKEHKDFPEARLGEQGAEAQGEAVPSCRRKHAPGPIELIIDDLGPKHSVDLLLRSSWCSYEGVVSGAELSSTVASSGCEQCAVWTVGSLAYDFGIASTFTILMSQYML